MDNVKTIKHVLFSEADVTQKEMSKLAKKLKSFRDSKFDYDKAQDCRVLILQLKDKFTTLGEYLDALEEDQKSQELQFPEDD